MNSNKPRINMHPPVSFPQLVKEGYLTFDACALMHQYAHLFVLPLIDELKRQKRHVWVSADVLAELRRKANDSTSDESSRRLANRGIYLYQLMVDAGVLDTYSDSHDVDQVCDIAGRPVFADNVIVGRVRMFRTMLPCSIITFDRCLTSMLLTKPDCDCDTRAGFPVRVYRFDEQGQPCPVSLSDAPPADVPSDSAAKRPAPALRQRSVLPLSQLAALTSLENAPIPVSPLGGTVTGLRSGRSYPLGAVIGTGVEAQVFAVEDNDTLAVKVFERPTIFKIAKVTLLADQKLDQAIKDVALPIEEVVNPADGNVVGFVMKRFSGVSMQTLMAAPGQMRHAPDFNRLHYARMALSLIKQADALLSKGVLLADISPRNFMIAKEDGKLNPDRVIVIDVDSAQLGNAVTGLIPAEGHTPDYLAPCLIESGITPMTLRSKASLFFSVALLALQLVLAGVHPFSICSEDDKDLADHILNKRFPFGVGELRREANAIPGGAYLWSHLPKSAKGFFASIFRSDGERSKPETRPSLQEIASELEKLVYWFEHHADPEDLNLNPSTYRVYRLTCTLCGKTFDGNLHSAEARRHVICDGCLKQPAGQCTHCGKPLDMTRGEMLRKGLTRQPSRCKACHALSQAPVSKDTLLYVKCPACSSAHKAGQPCPSCAARAVAPVSKPVGSPASRAASPAGAPAPSPSPALVSKSVSTPDNPDTKAPTFLSSCLKRIKLWSA